MEVERKPQECGEGEREVAVEEEEDPFLQFIDYAKSVLSPDGNSNGDDSKGPSWRWITSRVLKSCIAYSSGVTSAILLSDLFQVHYTCSFLPSPSYHDFSSFLVNFVN